VDCDTVWNHIPNQIDFSVCAPDYRKNLPALSFFEPPQNRINLTTKKRLIANEHKYQGGVEPSELIIFAKKYMPVFRELLRKPKDLNNFLQ
jgi:hypothetical protein